MRYRDHTQNNPDCRSADGGYRREIGSQWHRFTAAEIEDIRDRDDLVFQLQKKYGLSNFHAQRDVDAFANGRRL